MAFDEANTSDNYGFTASIFLLNTTSGTLQTEFIQPPQQQVSDFHLVQTNEYQIVGWVDNTRMYIAHIHGQFSVSDHPTDVYILNTMQGTNQTEKNLQRITYLNVSDYGLRFNRSTDGTHLFVSVCYGCGQGGPIAPSSIMVFPAAGGSPQTIFNSPTFAITDVKAISPTTLLLMNDNQNDPGQSGIWKINIDGSGLTQLSNNGSSSSNFSRFQGLLSLCGFGRCMLPSWSNVSRDGSFYGYVFSEYITQNTPPYSLYTIFYGSLNGGSPKKVAFVTDDKGDISVVGWTAM